MERIDEDLATQYLKQLQSPKEDYLKGTRPETRNYSKNAAPVFGN